ncbi:hypothetical protein [Weissella thailandensis]|nr:hypothetical protein [Weissella thailandensis]GEP74345.1 hypothetical protein WTH01_05920 [Weissella thailandensis]
MNPESHDNVSRLKQLKERPETERPGSRQARLQKKIKHSDIQWLALLLCVISQNIIWWVYPLIYSNNLAGGQWQHNPLLITYSIIIAIAIFLTFNRGFSRWINYVVILFPLLFLYFLYKQFTGQQVMLLALLPITLLLINISWLSLQNVLGLILYSGIATIVMPVVIFYQQNTYLTQPFIISLLPLFFSYLYFMSSVFVTQGRNKRLTSLVFGVILLLNVLTLPWNFWTILTIIIIIFTWMVLINFNLKQRYRMVFFTILQTLTIMVIFLQQN